MLKENELVKVRWNSQTKKYWLEHGYEFTKLGDYFYAKVNDVPDKSVAMVGVVCDYCGKEFKMHKYAYTRSAEFGKVACKNCKPLKIKEANIVKYGVENSMQRKEVQEKVNKTMLERYGVEHIFQDKDVMARVMEKYDYKKAVEKRKLTCLEKYGVDNAAKNAEVNEKARKTCIERYGGESAQCSAEVKSKTWESMLQNGTIPTSKLERELVSMLIDIYGKDKCTPQYNLDRISMDCLLVVDDIKIDVEYDGTYWHKQKEEYDKRRDYYCFSRGYKVLRFSANRDKIPTIEQIKECVDYLVNSKHKHLKIDI